MSDIGPTPVVYPPNASYTSLEPLDGVTTGFLRIHVSQLRSFDDRLGKAARKADNGDVAAAWIAVGRVQAELRSLLLLGMPSATRRREQEPTESDLGTEGPQ